MFKSQKTTSTKRTLMVFIRPTIIDSEDINNPSTQKALSTVEKEQKLFNQKDMLLTPDLKRYQITPQTAPLPELDNSSKTVTP
jgi:type II secretory pathway component GspD/PulD (secretin)